MPAGCAVLGRRTQPEWRPGSQALPALGEQRANPGLAGLGWAGLGSGLGSRHESVTPQHGAPGALARLTLLVVRKADPQAEVCGRRSPHLRGPFTWGSRPGRLREPPIQISRSVFTSL